MNGHCDDTGIVGKTKFQYDIWGDTVNIASRLKQSCQGNKINVSETTNNLIQHEPEFYFASRGLISVEEKKELKCIS